MKMSFSTSMPGLHGCVSVRDHASRKKLPPWAARGQRASARIRATANFVEISAFRPPPLLSRKSGPPQAPSSAKASCPPLWSYTRACIMREQEHGAELWIA